VIKMALMYVRKACFYCKMPIIALF